MHDHEVQGAVEESDFDQAQFRIALSRDILRRSMDQEQKDNALLDSLGAITSSTVHFNQQIAD